MRDGDFTTGQYNVLLPDGRKQVSEMTDQTGQDIISRHFE